MEKTRYVGAEIHRLEKTLFKNLILTGRRYGLEDFDRTHLWILKFLYHNQDKEIYQKDLESVISASRSTVTCMVKSLEKNGYIRREEGRADARLKKLILTEAGIRKYMDTVALFEEVDLRIREGITESEMEIFLRVVDRMRDNALVMIRANGDVGEFSELGCRG